MSIKNPKSDQIISKPEQLRAISSPIRNSILTVIVNQGQASIREIAFQLGMKPASLYRHIDTLLECGAISEEGRVSTARRDARVFSSRLEYIEYQPKNPEMLEALCGFIRQGMKTSAQRIIRSTESGGAKTKGHDRDTFFGCPFSWLDDGQIEELNDHINAIMDLMLGNQRREGSRLIGLSIGMHPMPIRERTEVE